MGRMIRTGLTFLVLSNAVSPASAADPVEEFFRGKQMQLIVGFGVGDGFDTYARILSRHMPRHIPGKPSLVIQNMPGVGSQKALNYLLTIAPKDGTVFALVNPTATTDALFYPGQAAYDPLKLEWLGSMSSDTTTCGFWTREPITVETLRAREFIVGGTALTSGTMRANRVLSSVLGLKFKFVSGYRTLGDLTLAAEKGEVQGYCGVMVSTMKLNWWDRYTSGALQVPLQAAIGKDPDLPNVPNALDLATSEQDRQLLRLFVGPWHYGRPFLSAPNVPRDRLEALRNAFSATLKDPEFLGEAKRVKLNVRPLTGAEVAQAIQKIYEAPKVVIERARPIMGAAQ